MSFAEDIDRALAFLRRHGRASLRGIALELGVDAERAKALRDELVDVLRLATDDGNDILSVATQSPVAPAPAKVRPGDKAERRLVTFVFCDLVASTPLATRLDPEDLRAVMLDYQKACNRAVERFEGHVSQWIGDGACMYFGFPKAHEDDAVRAIHAGQAMVSAVEGLQLEIRVGVHTGWAIVGDLGHASETLAFGEAPNICARIQSRARPGTVVVSDATHALVRGFFDFEDLGLADLKGLDRPVRLYQVGAPTGADVRFDVMRGQGLLPMVGRERERALLTGAWQACLVGAAPAILLQGEAGIGKSRLVHFARELVGPTARRLEITGSPYQRGSAMRAARRGLRRLLDLEDGTDAELLARLDGQVKRAGLEGPVALALLADALGIARPDGPETRKMEPAQIRARSLDKVCALVETLARTEPLLVIVEDMHWLDPSSEELVLRLLKSRGATRSFFLLTARPEYQLPDGMAAVVQTVMVESLPVQDAMQLALLATAEDPRIAELVELIAQRSGGNPLFIEELTRAVPLDEPRPKGKRADIPATLQSTLRARLDNVSPLARQIAEWGAVIGSGFDPRTLQAASGLETGDIRIGLAELVRVQLLRALPSPAGERFAFRHALQVDAVREGMLRSVSRARHLAVAKALLAENPEIGRSEPELIAHHYAEALETGQELHFRLLAVDRAVSQGAYREAQFDIARCLELIAAMPPGVDRDKAELRVRLADGGIALATLGQGSAEAKIAFDHAFELTQRLPVSPEGARALFGLWTYYLFRGDARTALVLAKDMLATARATGMSEPQMVAHFACSASEQMVGNLSACVSHADSVLERYDPTLSEDYIVRYAQDPRITVMTNACIALAMQGNVEAARRQSDETVAHARRLGHEFVLSIALQIPAFIAVHTGDAPAAMQLGLDWLAVAEKQENPVYPALAASVINWARAKGGAGDGLVQLRGVREGFRAQGVALADALFVAMIADAALTLGDTAQGLGLLASFDGPERGALTYQAEHRRLKAMLSLKAGAAPAEVQVDLERALALATEQGAGLFALRCAIDLAEVMGLQGRAAAARPIVQQALAAVSGDYPDVQAARSLLLRQITADMSTQGSEGAEV